MTIKARIEAQREKDQKPAGARAKGKKAEGEDQEPEAEGEEDDAEAEGEDQDDMPPKDKTGGKKGAKGKAAKGKKAEGEEDEATAEGEEDEATAKGEDDEDDDGASAADPGTVAQLCADAGVPHMAKPLINSQLPLSKVKGRIKGASQIRGVVAAAARIDRTVDPALADRFIANGASIEHVKAQMFDMVITNQSGDIRNIPPSDGGSASAAAIDKGWEKAAAKVNEQRLG